METFPELASKWARLCEWYNHCTLHVVPGPRGLSFFPLVLLLPTALLIPPAVLSHRQLTLVFLPLFLAYGFQTWRSNGILDVITITGLQWSFVLLACYDPRRDFRRVLWERTGPENSDGKDEGGRLAVREQAYPESLLERIPWVLTLLVSIRLAGWKTGDLFHDKTQPIPRSMTRTVFLKRALKMCVFNYILLDISACYALTDPYFTTSEMSVDIPFSHANPSAGVGGFLLILIRHSPPRLIRCCTLAAHIHGLIAGGFFSLTIPIVSLNAMDLLPDEWSPHTWPVFFGEFSAVLTRGLRGLWGTWWHQMNRQIHATPGRALISIMGVTKESLLGKMTVLMVAFGLSGWMHMGMIPPEPLWTTATPHRMRLAVAAFFWAQPLGIALEYAVMIFLNWIAPRVHRWPMAQLVVLTWVSTWLCLTLPWLTVPFRELGYWTVYPIPLSILNGLAGYGWRTWH